MIFFAILVSMSVEHQQSPEIQKPKVLYHASSNRNIEEFEPRNEHTRGASEGPVVFATPNKAFATCFIVDTDDSWVNIGSFSEKKGVRGPLHVIISDQKRFENSDKGGAVYSLPADTFGYEADLGMGDMEWVSKVPVKPIDKQEFEFGLMAMKEAGVEVYFVDKTTFDSINSSSDHGKVIIDTLTPEA